MKQKILFRLDGGFDKPKSHSYSVILSTSNKEGIKLMRGLSLQKKNGNKYAIIGYNGRGAAQRAKMNPIFQAIAGKYFKKIEYYGGSVKEFCLFLDTSSIGYVFNRFTAIVNSLLPMIDSIPNVDSSEQGRQENYVVYSVRVPDDGDYIGYKVPFSQEAYNKRVQAEYQIDLEKSKTLLEVETNEKKAAEQDAEEQNQKAAAEKAKNEQTKYKTVRWVSIGIIVAVVVGIVIFAVVKSKK